MRLLYNLEQEFKTTLEDAKNSAMYDELTIEELLDLGFNNNYLILSNGEEIELGYIDENGEKSEELTEEQLNTHIYMDEGFGWYDDDDIDADGYHIAKVYLKNQEDERLFVASDDE